MDTPTYPVTITIGGANQTTDSGIGSVMPRVINTRQSGQIILTALDYEGNPFDLSSLDGMDVKAKPYNTSDVPVTLGVGAVSGVDNNIFTVSWVRDSFPAGWSSFAQDRDGAIVIYVELQETGVEDYYQWATRVNVEDGDYVGDASTLPLLNLIFYYNPTWLYDNDTTATDPGAETFKMNDTTIANVTELYVSADTYNQLSFDSLLSSLNTGTFLYASNPNVQNDSALFLLSGAPTDNGGWYTIPVTNESTGTLSFTNGIPLSLNFVPVTSGDVAGPASATDNAIARFDGATGKAIQNSIVGLDDLGNFLDDNGNELIAMTQAAAAVNHLNISNADTGSNPSIFAEGDDANVSLELGAQGTGVISLNADTDFQDVQGIQNLLNLEFTDYSELTISGGVVTATQVLHTVDTEGGAATDDLDTITAGPSNIVWLKLEDPTRVVTLKDGTGNLTIGEDIEMDADTIYPLVYNGSSWEVLGGAGGGTDEFAIHVNIAGEIVLITEKTTISLDDVIVIEDSSDSDNKKSQTLRTTRQDVSNAQVGLTYQLLATDGGQTVRMNNAAANDVTIPDNGTEAIEIGTVIVVTQIGAGSTTITADSGVSLNGIVTGSMEIGNQYSSIVLIKVATDEWEASASNAAAIQGRIDSPGNITAAQRIPLLVDGEQVNIGFDAGTDLVTIQIKGRYLITHNFVKNNDANTAEVFVGLNGTPTLGNNIGRSYITVLAPTVNGGGMLSFSNVVALDVGDEVEFYLNAGEIAGGPQDFNWWSITKIN